MRLVFVSSTFKDMQFERDELKNRVAPRIDSFLAKYGENVHFGDLRWGVNTTKMSEEESSKKVLKVCLDEIDDCRPYMIVFIGERYGWIPSQDLILEAAKARGMGDINPDISVTNLEIEYGALLNPDYEGRILFYFRNLDTSEMDEEEKKIYEAESIVHKQKLDALKSVILEKYPGFVRFYDAKYDKTTKTIVNLNPVMEQVYNDMCRIFKIDLDKYEALPNYQRAIMNSHTRFEKYYKNAYRLEDFDYSLGEWDPSDDYLMDEYKEIPTMRTVSGQSGMGRKTNLSILYQEALENKDIPAYPFVVGLDEYTKGVDELAEFFMNIFEGELDEETVKDAREKYDGFEIGSLYSHLPYLSKLISIFDETCNKRIRFFIMNCNEKVMDLLREIEANLDGQLVNVSFYISIECGDVIKEPPVPFWAHWKSSSIFDLSENDKIGVINAILKSKHKELPASIIKLITNISQSTNPLYISLIIERLLLLDHQDFQNICALGDGMVAIEKYMTSIVNNAGKDIKAISKELLKELKERINPITIPIVIRLLSYDFLLSNKEIEEFFKFMDMPWDEVDYSLFVHSIPSLFKDSSLATPCLEFKINEIKEAAIELADEWGVKDYSFDIIRYLEQKDDDIVIKDTRLIEAYRVFDQKEKSLNHYLHILDNIDDEKYTNYELTTFDKLTEEYQQHQKYYIDVFKLLFDRVAEGELNNYVKRFDLFFQIMDVHFSNETIKIDWCNMVVEILGYVYDLYLKNKNNDELFFLLMVGLNCPGWYLDQSDLIDIAVDDDHPYKKSYIKASEFCGKHVHIKRYRKLREKYSEQGFHFGYLFNFVYMGDIIKFDDAINSSDSDDLTSYIYGYEDTINEMYNELFVNNDNPLLNEIVSKYDLNQDQGESLFYSACKFIQLMNDEYIEKDEAEALKVFEQYSTIFEKYVYNMNFFNRGTLKNYSLFLFNHLIIDFLLHVSTYANNFEDDDISEQFSKLVQTDINYAIILGKLYLSNHSDDSDAIDNYIDLLIANNAAIDSDSKEQVKTEAYNFLYIMNISFNSLSSQNPRRAMIMFFILCKSLIGVLFKDIDRVNEMFSNRLFYAYFTNIRDYDNAYMYIATTVYQYLFVTEQTKNTDIIKKVYDEIIKNEFLFTSYREFKTDIMHSMDD